MQLELDASASSFTAKSSLQHLIVGEGGLALGQRQIGHPSFFPQHMQVLGQETKSLVQARRPEPESTNLELRTRHKNLFPVLVSDVDKNEFHYKMFS